MRRALTLSLLVLPHVLSAQENVPEPMPKGVRVSTWVREDLFAGYIDGDIARHTIGMKKLDSVLAANPQALDALAWRAGSKLFLAVRDAEAGNAAGFDAAMQEFRRSLASVAEAAAKNPDYLQGVFAISGGIGAVLGDRVPAQYRQDMWRLVRDSYTGLMNIQKPYFDNMPVHHRGELLAGLAQAAQRLGEPELAEKLTQDLVARMPGTPYAVFGKRWLDNPGARSTSKLVCSSCHDAGRLQAVLSKR